MDKQFIKNKIDEFFNENNNSKKDDLFLLETTLYIENTFSIKIEDSEINQNNLDNPEKLSLFVQSKIGK